MKKKLKPCFKASVQPGGILELLVYECIGYDFWSDGGVTAKTVKQQINDAGVFTSINVRINSPGGDAFEGIAVMNLLRAQKKPVNVYVDGIAASAASVIAMAGDTITMGRSAMMMVHNAWSYCMGDGDDMRKCGDTLDRVSQTVATSYMARTGKTAAQIKTIMDEETWMGADECLSEGFATAIVEDDGEEAMALAKTFKSLAKMKHVPAVLKPKADEGDDAEDSSGNCVCPCGPCTDGDCSGCNCSGCDASDCAANACDCGESAVEDSNLSQYEARLKLLLRA